MKSNFNSYFKLKRTLLVSSLFLLGTSCQQTSPIENYIGTWASTNPQDSIAPVFIFKKTGESVFLDMKFGKQLKEVTANFNPDTKEIDAAGITFNYLPDSGYIKFNMNGKSENLVKIDDIQLDKLESKIIEKQNADSIKKVNQTINTKKQDNDIANDILKRNKGKRIH